jgi:hypothetical protein
MLENVNNVEKSLNDKVVKIDLFLFAVHLTSRHDTIGSNLHILLSTRKGTRQSTADVLHATSAPLLLRYATNRTALCNAFNSTKWTPALRQLQIHTPRPNQQVLIVWQNFMLFENKTKFTCVSLKNIRTRLLRQWCILFSSAQPHV